MEKGLKDLTDLARVMVLMAAAMAVGNTQEVQEHWGRALALGFTIQDMLEILAIVRGERLKFALARDKEAESFMPDRSLALPVMTDGNSCGRSSGSRR